MNRLLLKSINSNDCGGNWNLDLPPEGADKSQTATIGLRLFLVVVSSLFFLFFIAFIARSQIADWHPLTEPLGPLANPWQLWANTGFLVFASIALQWARVAVRRGDKSGTVLGFALGGVFAVAFLAGQFWVWQQFAAWGYFVSSNPANSFFYLLTGLHGLHLLGGLVAWAKALAKLMLGVPLSQLRASLKLCAIYWHYLLGLWLLLFALLTSPPETYEAIAAFCGLR